MNEENKRKTIILTFIGALTLLFVVVGGTFAYFQIVSTGEGETSSTLTGETEGLTKYGTPTLNQGINNLHINLKASDMGYSKKGTPYWATNVEENDYETDKQQHIISTAKISGAESEDTELSCTSELTIKGKITEMVNGESKEVTVNPLVEEDGYVYLGSKNGGSNKVSINPTQIDLKQIIDKSMGEEGVGYQTEISYTIKGNTSIDITVDIDIINRDANQNSLAGKSINFTITNKNISCSVKEPKGKVYMTSLVDMSKMESEDMSAIKLGMEKQTAIEKIEFVKRLPVEEEIDRMISEGLAFDLTDTSMSLEKSVIGWLEASGNRGQVMDLSSSEPQLKEGNLYNLYIGSNETIYAKDLSGLSVIAINLKEINFDNLNTSETTNMSYMFSPMELESQLTTLDLSSFDTSKVTNMSYMFYGYEGTTLDLSSFDTSSVTDMSYMFGGLITADLPFKEWKKFVTTNVENMSYMFSGYEGTTLDLSTFDTSKVTNMSYMFDGCTKLKELKMNKAIFGGLTTSNSYNHIFGYASGSSDIRVPSDIHIIVKKGQEDFINKRMDEIYPAGHSANIETVD